MPELNSSDENENSFQLPEQQCSDEFLNCTQLPELNSSDENENSFQLPEPSCSEDHLNTNAYDENIQFSQITGKTYAYDETMEFDNTPTSPKVDDISTCPTEGEHVWENSVTDTPMHNPDQVAHAFSPHSTSSRQESGIVTTGLDLNNIITERSLEFESHPFSQVSLPVVSDLPGFDNLDQAYDTPPAWTNDEDYQQSFYGASLADSTSSSAAWYTPPQSPSCDRLTSEPVINAMDAPLVTF